MSYINDCFLLTNDFSKKLYNNYAKDMPIFDYHCHLSEYQILEDKEFNNIYEIWLGGDHYKWRLMRNYGISEDFITGNKSPKEKFLIYCQVLSSAFGNPLYHWSQIELKEFFDCDLEINEKNSELIWEHCNSYIKSHHIKPSSLINKSNVKYIFTTNEIFDDLNVFKLIKKKNYPFEVYPAFRADKIMNIEADKYLDYIAKLGNIKNLDELEKAVEIRLKEFIKVGAKASDTALNGVYPISKKIDAEKVFNKRLKNGKLKEDEIKIFKGYFTYFLFELYGKYHIVSELHLGAMRNNNTKMFLKLGLDSGFDSIAEDNSIKNLSLLMDALNNNNSLPSMILFNLHPKMNFELLTLLGCFQDSSKKGKIQYGPAWWFLDHKEGMERHLKDLVTTGHIATFIGMLTDSRSFLSYPRHHYFRRILCNYFGELMEKHEITQDISFVGKIVEDICFNNVKKFFDMD